MVQRLRVQAAPHVAQDLLHEDVVLQNQLLAHALRAEVLEQITAHELGPGHLAEDGLHVTDALDAVGMPHRPIDAERQR